MVKIQSILCPIDFSDCSGHALDYARDLAKLLGASLRLLHVYEDPISTIPFAIAGTAGLPTTPVDLVNEARSHRLVEASRLQKLCTEHGVTTHVEEVEGLPAETIIKVAKDTHADLIVMGTHGRTGLSHLVVGSIAERVVRLSSCPVLTVRSPNTSK